jgi:hypothetical protein
MRERSLAEQRYRAVLAVISDGRMVTEIAAAVGCTVRTSETVTLNRWLAVVSGNNVVSCTPTITLRIPPGAVAGTSRGTITHSVL